MENKQNLFESILIQIKEPLNAGESVEIEWKYKDFNPDMIDDFSACSCTNIRFLKDRVVAVYTDTHKSEDIKDMQVVTKNLTLFFKDGKPLRVPNERGVMVRNPLKDSLALMFHVSVIP